MAKKSDLFSLYFVSTILKHRLTSIMKSIKMIKPAFVLLSLLMISLGIKAQATNDPYVFVKQVATATFDRMKKDQVLIHENRNILKSIIEQELLPHIDHRYSALFVLGTNAKSLPKEKVDEFSEVFKQYLLSTYAVSLGYYKNQLVEFEPSKPYEGKKTVSIKAFIKEPGKQDIDVVFQVRLNKSGEWKAYDMIAEGVSVIQTKRSEFTPLIRQKGVDAVITLMKEKSDKPLKTKEER